MRSVCVGVAETGEIKQCTKCVAWRRRDGSQSVPLFVLFVLFGQAKRTLKEKNHKETFLLSYFSVTKSTKSQQGGLTPSSFRTSVRRARVSRTSHAWQVRAARDKTKVGTPHSFSHTTRANIAHERAEQIRARIVCTPSINAGRELTDSRKRTRSASPSAMQAQTHLQ